MGVKSKNERRTPCVQTRSGSVIKTEVLKDFFKDELPRLNVPV